MFVSVGVGGVYKNYMLCMYTLCVCVCVCVCVCAHVCV